MIMGLISIGLRMLNSFWIGGEIMNTEQMLNKVIQIEDKNTEMIGEILSIINKILDRVAELEKGKK